MTNEMALITVEVNLTEIDEITIEKMADYLGITVTDIDSQFGVICIDPQHNKYTLMINTAVLDELKRTMGKTISGPYSNPQIESF